MPKMIFVSLPVTDLAASTAFYEALGFTRNPQFSDATSACMVWSDTIYAMLLTHAKWRSFTDRPLPPSGTSQVMLSLFTDFEHFATFKPAAYHEQSLAAMLDQVVALAGDSAPGGAINAFEAQRRDEALRPLSAACRLALVTACNSPLVSAT